MNVDDRIPAYLARILDGSGDPVSSGFVLPPRLLITAAHALFGIGISDEGAEVSFDFLNGAPGGSARLLAMDRQSDIAVLHMKEPARLMQGPGFASTDGVITHDKVVITGLSHVDDPGHTYQFMEVGGNWQGPVSRDEVQRLAHVKASGVVPGMSGAPVRRLSDGAIIGIVSGRYNTDDGWLEHEVWISRIEDLEELCPMPLPLAQATGDVGLEGKLQLIKEMVDRDLLLPKTAEDLQFTLCIEFFQPIGDRGQA